jgi:hypothetical protein
VSREGWEDSRDGEATLEEEGTDSGVEESADMGNSGARLSLQGKHEELDDDGERTESTVEREGLNTHSAHSKKVL